MKQFLSFIIIAFLYACKKPDSNNCTINFEVSKETESSEKPECSPGLLYGVARLDGFKVHLQKTNESDFEKRKAEDFIKFEKTKNSDSLEKAVQKRFPDIFYKKNECYLFFPKNQNEEVIVMNYISPDVKNSSSYTFVSSYKNFILINQQFYEGEGYLVINTTNREVYWFANEPRFINEHRLYSLGDNYGTTDLQVYDFEEDRYMAIEINNLQGFRPRESYATYGSSSIFIKFDHYPLDASFYEFYIQENSR
ncbi:hypothetical protein QRD02_01165 [Aequorivita sp. SDUM287046]|uniref:Lipoprotein n=1 Tax=Aequorivita aurantiaca TaxID=3053356 RepID=A0ABT8DIF2_9FLAO|nr:hypothetical protein [Aequorivita aurantiaca]MDN3722978.1 hypothetical protein [Aequorivita aurantiaca]